MSTSNPTAAAPIPRRLPTFLSDPRARVLTFAAIVLVAGFWLLLRYPALMHKSDVVGERVASMTFASAIWSVAPDAPLWKVILAGAVNWLNTMKVGMSFGVLFGALLHTALRYYPLKVSENMTMNSIKGALVGMPMGICANCAVPTSCGVTRGNGRLEVVLGFLFSSPNFNPVVVMMTITALPLSMVLVKYGVLALMIVVGVPWLVRNVKPKTAESEAVVDEPLGTVSDHDARGIQAVIDSVKAAESAEAMPLQGPSSLSSGAASESMASVAPDLAKQFLNHVWMLLKPTIAIMLIASFAASTALALLPLDEMLANPSFLSLGAVSLISTLMPVPIALDVLFAGQLQATGTAPGYVMLFAMTLGTFSIVPAIYMWREISRKLSITLVGFFVVLGWALAWVYQAV